MHYGLINIKIKKMKTITVPNKEQLSAESQTILESVEKKMGKIPISMPQSAILHQH